MADYWNCSLENWLLKWLDEWMLSKKWSTVRSYTFHCQKNIIPYIGSIPITALNVEHINKLYKTLSEQGLAPKTIRNIHGILHEALAIAYELDGIPKNPTDNRHIIQLPKVPKTQIKPLTDVQIKDFLSVASDNKYFDYFRFLLFTGMRENEAAGLTWECVDLKSGIIRIEKQLLRRPVSEGGWCFAPLKNNKVRTIIIGTSVTELLKAVSVTQRANRKNKLWNEWVDPHYSNEHLVFTTSSGNHYTDTVVRRYFKELVQKIGCPKARIHDLRHTYACLALNNGDDVKTVQSSLGHASAAFTLDVYGHVLDKSKHASAQRMDQYINSIK